MIKYLHPLFEMEGAIGSETGVESAPAAEVQTETPATPEVTSESTPGVESEAAAEPEKLNNFEKAFAKRLAAEREKWQQEMSERYKDYDAMQKATEYLLKQSGISDPLTLKEQIELAELKERAEEQNVPVEFLKRMNELEAKSQKFEQYEQQQQVNQQITQFRNSLESFAKDKGDVEASALEQYMIENQVRSFDIAYRALKFESLQSERQRFETERETFEKEAVKRYLESKNGPKVEGTGSPGMTLPKAPTTWEEARQGSLEMLRSANQKV